MLGVNVRFASKAATCQRHSSARVDPAASWLERGEV